MEQRQKVTLRRVMRVFALVSIRFFLTLISRIKLMPFALYRIALAIVLAVIVF